MSGERTKFLDYVYFEENRYTDIIINYRYIIHIYVYIDNKTKQREMRDILNDALLFLAKFKDACYMLFAF